MHLCRVTSEALLRSTDLTLAQSIIHKKNTMKCRLREEEGSFLLGGKAYNSLFYSYETSGGARHLAASRWQTNMPITNTDMPCWLLGNLALSDSTLKSENDTSEADLTNPLHQSVTKAQRNSYTGLSCPHDCFSQESQSLGNSLESKE